MTNCPYCNGEIPSKDFAVKSPKGDYWHMPCADMALDEWVRLKEENATLHEAVLKNSNIIVNYPSITEGETISILRKMLQESQQEVHRLRHPELYFGMAAQIKLADKGLGKE